MSKPKPTYNQTREGSFLSRALEGPLDHDFPNIFRTIEYSRTNSNEYSACPAAYPLPITRSTSFPTPSAPSVAREKLVAMLKK